jgi:hypothetical protein
MEQAPQKGVRERGRNTSESYAGYKYVISHIVESHES